MHRTVLTFVLFIGAAFAPDAGAGPDGLTSPARSVTFTRKR